MKPTAIVLIAIAAGLAAPALAQNQIAKLRGNAPLDANNAPPPIAQTVNSDIRQVRNYPDQPPLIPHKIDDYQVDLSFNKCLSCHSRAAVGESQAPMISVTHFMNRDGQFLASVSPRRFFCTQCHVPQSEAPVPVENTFVDVDSVLDYLEQSGAEGKE